MMMMMIFCSLLLFVVVVVVVSSSLSGRKIVRHSRLENEGNSVGRVRVTRTRVDFSLKEPPHATNESRAPLISFS